MPISKEDTRRALSILESILTRLASEQETATSSGEDGEDLEDLRRLQSTVDVMRSPLFSAIVDIRSRQAEEGAEEAGNVRPSTGESEVKLDSHPPPELLSHFAERYGISEATLSNGAPNKVTMTTSSTHLECNGARGAESSCRFELKSTFAADDLEWNGDTAAATSGSPMINGLGKKTATPIETGRTKKGSWRGKEADSSSPLRRGKKEEKNKSSKKISLGWRKRSSKSKPQVTLADLAHSVPRMSPEGTRTGIESPSIGNGSLDHVDWVRHGSVEIELCDSTSGSRKSYSQEEESSLSEVSALIDSISLQSEPLLTETEHLSTTATRQWPVTMETNNQPTVIKNYDALDSEPEGNESVKQKTGVGKGEEHVAIVTVIENCNAFDSVARGRHEDMKSNDEESAPLFEVEKTKNVSTAAAMVNRDASNVDDASISGDDFLRSTTDDSREDKVTTVDPDVTTNNGNFQAGREDSDVCFVSGSDGDGTADHGDGTGDHGDDGDGTGDHGDSTGDHSNGGIGCDHGDDSSNGVVITPHDKEEGKGQSTAQPKDILFFMRDQQSQGKIKQVLQGQHGRSPRTVSLEVCEVSLVAGGGASIGIDMVGLSSTGVFVGGVSMDSTAEGKVQAGDQILQINGKSVENMASFEVDMIPSEVPVGDTVELTVLYNPSGLAEYHRLQTRRKR